MNKKLKKYYSGKKSIKFWDRVNDLAGARGNAMYSLGVVLQNLEADVLRKLELFEQEEKDS